MLTFKSAADLQQLPTTHPAYAIIEDLVMSCIVEPFNTHYRPYDPADDGFICLVEEGDQDRAITEVWEDGTIKLLDLRNSWEGIMPVGNGYWQAVFLANNECGFVFVIPDTDWVTGDLRQSIMENLDP